MVSQVAAILCPPPQQEIQGAQPGHGIRRLCCAPRPRTSSCCAACRSAAEELQPKEQLPVMMTQPSCVHNSSFQLPLSVCRQLSQIRGWGGFELTGSSPGTRALGGGVGLVWCVLGAGKRLGKLRPRGWWDQEWTFRHRNWTRYPVRGLISLTSLGKFVLWSKTEFCNTVQSQLCPGFFFFF